MVSGVGSGMRGISGIVHWLGGAERSAGGERRVPGRKLRVVLAPLPVRKPKVEIGERAADRDMADRKRAHFELRRFPFECRERGLVAHGKACEVGLGLLLRGSQEFAAPQHQGVEPAVAERLAAQCGYALAG